MDLKFIYKYVNIFENIIQIYLLNGDESEQNLLSVVQFYPIMLFNGSTIDSLNRLEELSQQLTGFIYIQLNYA